MPGHQNLCGRCGIRTTAEYCKDCRSVDPIMTAGGLSAREMAAKIKAENEAARLEYYMLLGGLDNKARERELARRRAARSRQRERSRGTAA